LPAVRDLLDRSTALRAELTSSARRFRPRSRMTWAIVAIVAVVFVGVVVLPTRAWFAQRSDLGAAKAERNELEAGNAKLAEKIETLADPGTIEQQARELYGYVYPRQESYTVPPGGAPQIDLPKVWPFDQLQDPLQRAAERKAAPSGVAGG
jgi:cell division protein FtsB